MILSIFPSFIRRTYSRGCVDAVIEFNELQKWLEEEGIDLKHCESRPFANQDPMVNQLYPITNGL